MRMVSFRSAITVVTAAVALLVGACSGPRAASPTEPHAASGTVSPPVGTASTASAVLAGSAASGPWRIGTFAGGVGGPGAASKLAAGACAVASVGDSLYSTGLDPAGNLAGNVVRRIGMHTGWETTAAGTGLFTYRTRATPQNGAPAAQTTIGSSCGLAVDRHGNLIFTDYDLGLVRVLAAASGTFFGKPMMAGHVYTIGGGGSSGYPGGDGGPAASARLSGPAGVAVDAAGNVVFDDSGVSAIRLIAATSGTFYGRRVSAGDIYTVAGGHYGEGPFGVPATASGLMLTDSGGEYSGIQPWPVVAVDHFGDIVLAEGGGNDGEGIVAVVAAKSGTFYGQPMTAGDIYALAGGGRHLGNGIPGRQAGLCTPSGVGVDHAGNVLVTDAYSGCHRVYVIAAATGRFYGRAMRAGYIYVIAGTGKGGSAGDGGPALHAEFSGPEGVSVDSAGNVVLADGFNAGNGDSRDNDWLRVIAEANGSFYGRRLTTGNLYTISGQGHGWSYFGDGGPATHALIDTVSGLSMLGGTISDSGVAVDKAGDAAFSDMSNYRIRLVPATSGTWFGRKMTAGYIYTIGGDGHWGYSGDGGLATRARLNEVPGVAFDAVGNVLLTDANNHRVRVVAARSCTCYRQTMTAGHVYTIAGNGRGGYSGDGGAATAAELGHPAAIAVDHQDNVVVADLETAGSTVRGRIRVIAARTGSYYGHRMTAGHIYTIAQLSANGLAVDAAGNLVVSGVVHVKLGTRNGKPGWFRTDQVQVVAARQGRFYGQDMIPGRSYAIAGKTWFEPLGSRGAPASPDGGQATATVVQPDGVAVDQAGNVIIADHSLATALGAHQPSLPDQRVRIVAVRSGTFYGVAMTAGHIYTIAGDGLSGLGDGGPPLRAMFVDPTGVAVAPSGAILILDSTRIRVVYR
jgi:trimeric autotransporter adhesin